MSTKAAAEEIVAEEIVAEQIVAEQIVVRSLVGGENWTPAEEGFEVSSWSR